ncbi:metallophosphoesterase [Hymenobacter edaphi]|uniref:Metallophosphoesterase n=1 Tax=Hymenobacter edaphi TaxID=2211146 RepID=A0A328B9R3_9BACT|nr:metallophosphoesterase [Hymenobacter edaphi]RAK62666.1 metallophosphoesterase [Hymenobacter edaphi]
MKRPRTILKIIVKWGLIGAVGYGVLTTLLLGQNAVDEQAGRYTYNWSGLDALVNDEPLGFFIDQPVPTALDGVDGPYVVGRRVFTVDARSRLRSAPLRAGQPLPVRVGNADQDSFLVALRPAHARPPETYPLPTRLLAVSDIEGNFDGFVSLLRRQGVVDAGFNWSFGRGHLVLNGDFVDRGGYVTPVLWLIYRLEAQAAQAGGQVHYVLGNHEVMMLYGDQSYAQYKYIEAARQISGRPRWDQAGPALFGADTELGRWLRSKNVAERLGPYLFVHAGLKAQLVQQGLTLPDLNRIARQHYGHRAARRLAGTRAGLVLSSYHSPYWDRSLAMNWLYRAFFFFRDPRGAAYHRTTPAELTRVLRFYRAQRLVIGHSVVANVTADYDGRVLKIDVKHGQAKNTGRTQGLLIENGAEYRVDDRGGKARLGTAAR